MGEIFGEGVNENREVQFNSWKDFDIRVRIREMRQDFISNLMTLVDNDVTKYNTLKSIAVDEYLTLLEFKIRKNGPRWSSNSVCS